MKTANYGASSSLPLPRPSPNSYQAQHRPYLRLLPPNRPDDHPPLPTIQKLQPNSLDDTVEMPSGSLHAVKMEGDNNSSHPKTPRANLPSPEKATADVSKQLQLTASRQDTNHSRRIPGPLAMRKRFQQGRATEVTYATALGQITDSSNGRPRAQPRLL